MKLNEYTAEKRGRTVELAAALKVPTALISQWQTGVRQVPAERCPLIERATGGAVRCEDLRPDVAWDVVRDQAKPDAEKAAA